MQIYQAKCIVDTHAWRQCAHAAVLPRQHAAVLEEVIRFAINAARFNENEQGLAAIVVRLRAARVWLH